MQRKSLCHETLLVDYIVILSIFYQTIKYVLIFAWTVPLTLDVGVIELSSTAISLSFGLFCNPFPSEPSHTHFSACEFTCLHFFKHNTMQL